MTRTICSKTLAAFAAVALALTGTASAQTAPDATDKRIERILRNTPLIDGHNDLPGEIRGNYDFWRKPLELRNDTSALPDALATDIPRLRSGHVGAQFWSVYISARITGPRAVETTLEQIDIVRRIIARYPDTFELAGTTADIRRIHKAGRIASLMGAEGGHQINNNLAVLRQYYVLGVRYMTLTHSDNVDWADSATANPVHHGLTPFGLDVIREMNRIGMLVDLSHVSAETMKAALAVAKAPVIFSHSSARAVVDHPRNVPDDVLRLLPANGGVVMVTFVPSFISNQYNLWDADRVAELARLGNLYKGQPERVQTAMDAWRVAHPAPAATIAQVADHIEHFRDIAGIDHIGIGGDFDGTGGIVTQGLEGVDRYPALFRELIRRGWTDANLAKLAGGNVLRAMEKAERVASLSGEPPILTTSTSEQAPR